jgi:hypothetical protein
MDLQRLLDGLERLAEVSGIQDALQLPELVLGFGVLEPYLASPELLI